MFSRNGVTYFLIKYFLPTLVICFMIIAVSCTKDKVVNIYSPEEWRDLLDAAGDWVPLTIPDSRYKAASIVFNPEDTLRWVGNMKSCNFPDDLLEPVPGKAPQVNFSKAKEFSADALINYNGIEVGPKFNEVSKIQMIVDDHGTGAIDMIRLKVWWEIPDNRKSVSKVCMDELAKPDYYMVQEVFQVNKGKYILYDKKGAAIKLKAAALKDIINIQPNIEVSVTTDGFLSIEQPTTIAVRRVARVGNDWVFLKGDQEDTELVDSRIERLYLKGINNQ